MSKRKTQIDRVIEGMEAQIVELQRDYERRRQAIESAVDALRQQGQKVKRKPRTSRPVAVPA